MSASLRRFLIKCRSWEYWPLWVVYIPVYMYWLFLSLRARSLFFFSASNPSIENGGMLGESKFKILERVEDKPLTLLIKSQDTFAEVLHKIESSEINWPFAAKPDIGERGWGVKKIKSELDLKKYMNDFPVDFLIQEWVDLPVEAGVFYIRHPNEEQGKVTSIVLKDMLSVTGNGKQDLKGLIHESDRAFLQWEVLQGQAGFDFGRVPAEGEEVILNSVGNHCLGTTFLDGNHLIDEQVHESYDAIAKKTPHFYYGRFDLRAKSIDDLKRGKVKILELNGSGAEPAHIYQPGYSFFRAQKELLQHWTALFKISKANHNRGVKYLTWKEGVREFRKINQYNKRYKVG